MHEVCARHEGDQLEPECYLVSQLLVGCCRLHLGIRIKRLEGNSADSFLVALLRFLLFHYINLLFSYDIDRRIQLCQMYSLQFLERLRFVLKKNCISTSVSNPCPKLKVVPFHNCTISPPTLVRTSFDFAQQTIANSWHFQGSNQLLKSKGVPTGSRQTDRHVGNVLKNAGSEALLGTRYDSYYTFMHVVAKNCSLKMKPKSSWVKKARSILTFRGTMKQVP